MTRGAQRRNGRPVSTSAPRLGWERHWDPHPICWLEGTLTAAPYGWRPLGMRTCPSGGIAITFPNTDLLVGAAPIDRHRVTWSVHTHDPGDPAGHEPLEFGTFTWVRLDKNSFDKEASVFHLVDGTTLTVADFRGQSDTRYRIVSRADSARLVAGTETWADLAAIEQIAAQVYSGMRAITAVEPAGGGDAP